MNGDMNPLQKLRSECGSGSDWFSWDWARRLLDALIADRARICPSNGKEIPSPSGRFLVSDGGGSGVAFDVRKDGVWLQYSVPATLIGEAED